MVPLHWACIHGHADCVRLLLDYGADPEAKTIVRRPTPRLPPSSPRFHRPFPPVAGPGAPYHPSHSPAPAQTGIRPMHWAASNGRAECLRLLLDAGADPDARDKARACRYPRPSFVGFIGPASATQEPPLTQRDPPGESRR